MTRSPILTGRFTEAIPIAKARGLSGLGNSWQDQVFDIAIISKVPVAFARVMF